MYPFTEFDPAAHHFMVFVSGVAATVVSITAGWLMHKAHERFEQHGDTH